VNVGRYLARSLRLESVEKIAGRGVSELHDAIVARSGTRYKRQPSVDARRPAAVDEDRSSRPDRVVSGRAQDMRRASALRLRDMHTPRLLRRVLSGRTNCAGALAPAVGCDADDVAIDDDCEIEIASMARSRPAQMNRRPGAG